MFPWYKLQTQIDRYLDRREEMETRLAEIRHQSLATLQGELSQHWQSWKEAAQNNREHLAPDFDEDPSAVYDVDPGPPASLLMATDGSQIFPSRHEIAPVALTAISRIRIDYARYQETPLLDSLPTLLLREDLDSLVEEGREISFEELVSDYRTLDEMRVLASLAEESRSNTPALALTDGSLIMWRLAGRFEKQYEQTITQRFVSCLEQFQQVGVPLAGYISHSGSREVVNLVRLVEATLEGKPPSLPAKGEPRLTDSALFSTCLREGQRSALFHSQSKIMKRYGEQRISFFYLHVGVEVAKVEVPHWVAQDRKTLDRAAALCWSQVRLGRGYPLVLSEAHEHAVIRGAERETFYALVEQSMLGRGLRPSRSAKQMSKRTPVL